MCLATFDAFMFLIPLEAVSACSQAGDCDGAVADWTPKIHLEHIGDEDIRRELASYGAWDEDELKSREDNERRLVWIASGNLKETLQVA